MPWGISTLLKCSVSWRKYKERVGVISVPKQGNWSLNDPLGQRVTVTLINWGIKGVISFIYNFKSLENNFR